MKIFKKIFLVIGILIVIPLIVALFVEKDYSVEEEIVIDKPQTEVFDYLILLKNQDNFSVWAAKDPNMKKTYHGTDGTIGFISAWESDNPEVGIGEQEIKKITGEERIDYEIRFLKPFEAVAPTYMELETVNENQTKVEWGFNGRMDYPMNLMLLFMDMEEMVGADFQSGLVKLKSIIENN